ncbi:NAD(P)-dependent oxidoreductase [Vibrio sp. T187]|uniref:NAD(P)-dependent oxidoreductase n=1 Tax=Vibrio TaxID=662 RepID=UPI0010C94E14|nr:MULTISPECIES: NAD(P)-dependent oxidoreductase [Vibrio]MBW3695942.1 NAD(P)-dependent oxidoreductase [Vibrio sp. T187]
MNETIGFIGLGLMGNPMVARLLDAGYDVNVWARTPSKASFVVSKGANLKPDLEELVCSSDILMLCVSDTNAVEAIVHGDNGIISALTNCPNAKVKIIMDFSSISPTATTALAETLYKEHDIEWIDNPVSGGVAGAENGSLAIMCGGSESTIEKLKPIYFVLGENVTRMGNAGAGQVTKIGNQMLVSCNVLVMAEVFALAEKAGVDSTNIAQALSGGFADSLPLQITGPRMAERDYEPVKWHVKTLLKDLDMAKQLAFEEQASTPMAALAAELMRVHGNQGYLDSDPCTLMEQYLPSAPEK